MNQIDFLLCNFPKHSSLNKNHLIVDIYSRNDYSLRSILYENYYCRVQCERKENKHFVKGTWVPLSKKSGAIKSVVSEMLGTLRKVDA